MKETNNIAARIGEIGRKMVSCSLACDGAAPNEIGGVIPRCLIYEERPGKRGCAIVGINPGRAKTKERDFYREKGRSYDTVLLYWRENRFDGKYYLKLRELVTSFGLDGPILWTELAKCENAREIKALPLKTLRCCTGHFLNAELAHIPPHWPLFANGKEACKALAYRYPGRTVIGTPHCTGARGDIFSRHLPAGWLHRESKEAVMKVLSAKPGELLWLGDMRNEEGA